MTPHWQTSLLPTLASRQRRPSCERREADCTSTSERQTHRRTGQLCLGWRTLRPRAGCGSPRRLQATGGSATCGARCRCRIATCRRSGWSNAPRFRVPEVGLCIPNPIPNQKPLLARSEPASLLCVFTQPMTLAKSLPRPVVPSWGASRLMWILNARCCQQSALGALKWRSGPTFTRLAYKSAQARRSRGTARRNGGGRNA